jgi:hypothetical protein
LYNDGVRRQARKAKRTQIHRPDRNNPCDENDESDESDENDQSDESDQSFGIEHLRMYARTWR